jgi:hypothetical protein
MGGCNDASTGGAYRWMELQKREMADLINHNIAF